MKKISLLATILCSTAIYTVAQNPEWPTFTELIAKLPRKPSAPNRVLVSQPLKGANYSWNTNSSNWDANDSSFFSYNSQGLITEDSRGTDASNLTYRSTTTYDINYRITETMGQNYDAGMAVWVNQSKHTIVYDAHGNPTSDEYLAWDSGLNQWVINSGYQYAYTYNAQNQILTRTAQVYDVSLSAFENDYREINYTYNPFGNPVTWSEEEWDGSQWVSTMNYVYTYDVNGFPTAAQINEWDAATTAFVPAIKYDNVIWYNWTGDLEESLLGSLLSFSYNTTTSSWDTTARQTTTYGANNSYVSLDEVYFNGAFVNEFRATENIDHQGRTTLEKSESWDTTTDDWTINFQQSNTYTYDGNDDLTQRINQLWNDVSLVFVNNFRIDYSDYASFDNTTTVFTSEANDLKVYPNPMNESVTVSTAGLVEKATSIQLVDVNGVVVKTVESLTGTSTVIQREGLPNGFYFVQVKAGSTVLATTKLLLN